MMKMSDRHDKWVRVNPGTVVRAGQPHSKERTVLPGSGQARRWEYVGGNVDFRVPEDEHAWFVDSSWEPPLELPTEPTWGIVQFHGRWKFGEWVVSEPNLERVRGGIWLGVDLRIVTDFIPLTPEQAKRIEAAR